MAPSIPNQPRITGCKILARFNRPSHITSDEPASQPASQPPPPLPQSLSPAPSVSPAPPASETRRAEREAPIEPQCPRHRRTQACVPFSPSNFWSDYERKRVMAAEAAVRCRGARESVADQLHRSGLWDRGRSPPLLTPTNLCSVGMYLVWQVALSRGATAWCLFAAPSPRRVSHPNPP